MSRVEETPELRQELRELVARWASGSLTERDVHEQAELMLEEIIWVDVAQSDPRSIGLDVLSQLDILNWQLILVEDVPAIIQFLDAEPGGETAAWALWNSYWKGIDFNARRTALRGHPYYCVSESRGPDVPTPTRE